MRFWFCFGVKAALSVTSFIIFKWLQKKSPKRISGSWVLHPKRNILVSGCSCGYCYRFLNPNNNR